MLDLTTDKGRLISAALGLAAEKPWAQVTLADIAERGGSTLVALKAQFASKSEIVADFSRLVDDEVLRRAPARSADQKPRDALFEIVMSRFDILDPYKGALRSIAGSGLPEPVLIGRMLSAQGWMLEAAGIDSGGIGGGVRAAGLATVYTAVFQTWLGDDDPGLARTMAALDRRLRRGQRALDRVEEACAGVSRIGRTLFDIVGSGRRAPAKGSESTTQAPPSQPTA